MDGQNRNLHYQDVIYQNIPDPSLRNGSFPQESSGMTAETIDGSTKDIISTPSMDQSMLDIDDSSLAEFLRDIIMPTSPTDFGVPGASSMEFISQNYYTGRDVFNFGMESSLDFNDLDFGWINSQNTRPPTWNYFNMTSDHDQERLSRGQQTPDVCSGKLFGSHLILCPRFSYIMAFHLYLYTMNPKRKVCRLPSWDILLVCCRPQINGTFSLCCPPVSGTLVN